MKNKNQELAVALKNEFMDQSFENIEAQELQKAKRVIGQFINSCSHSMRGPLKSIEGLASLLCNPKANSAEDTKMFVDLIGKTARKMEHMLDELEHFMENSKRSLALVPINCQEAVDFVLNQHKEEIETTGIKVHCSIKQSEPFYSDMSRLRLIISHLLANAIQFRDDQRAVSEITITIKVRPDSCTIIISDNGIGIDPAEHFKIFQLFYRASERSTGSGIGLYVVREVVEKMGGTVYANSLLNQGATFTIELPNPCKNE